MKNIPIGISNFIQTLHDDCIYVDKTKEISGSPCICVDKRANLATDIGLSFRKTSSLKI